jgi:predicted MFS family arabinose efflux permease
VTPRGERLLVALLTTVQFTNITDFVVMMPLGPQLMRAFDIGPRGFGALVAAYNVSAGLSAVVASRLLDRFDRKRALIALYAGFILGTAACAIAPGFGWMMAARIVAGAFGGVLGAVIMSIIGDVIPYERRGAAMGAVMTAFALASVIGVPLGLWATTGWGWHAPFVLVALASLPVLVLAIVGIPSMRGHLEHAPPERGLLAHYGALLGDRGHLAALVMSTALTLGGFLVIPFMATYMAVNVGLGDHELAWLYLVGGATTIVTARLIGQLADRFGKHRVFVTVALLSLVPVIGLPRLPHLPTAAALAASTTFMVLVSGRFIPASALMTATVPAAQRGSFMSLNSAVQALTCGIATTIAGTIIVRHGEGPLERYDLVGLIAGAATLAAVWLSAAVHASVDGKRALTPGQPTPAPR